MYKCLLLSTAISCEREGKSAYERKSKRRCCVVVGGLFVDTLLRCLDTVVRSLDSLATSFDSLATSFDSLATSLDSRAS